MKALILAAGYGTRFLPVTKTLPKELLPFYDKTILDFALDECEDAGIEEVILITHRRKKVLEDYLDREVDMESLLKGAGRGDLLRKIAPRKLSISFLRQQEMLGTGHALLMAKPYVANEPVLVFYPDDVILSSPSLAKELVDLHSHSGKNILAVREEHEHLSRYGVISVQENSPEHLVQDFVEKPKPEEAPSHLVSIGRFVYTSVFFEALEADYSYQQEEQDEVGHSTEFYHVGALRSLARRGLLQYHITQGEMLDTGEPSAYLYSQMLYASRFPEMRNVLDKFYQTYYS